jgi:hypothetical protein
MRGSCGIKVIDSNRVPDLSLPFDNSEALGGRSEEISQICVVWGKAVALSRLEPPTVWFDPITLSTTSLYSDKGKFYNDLNACVYRKLKLGRSGGEVRHGV